MVAATTIGGFSLARYPQLGPLRDVNIGVLALLVLNLVVTALVAKRAALRAGQPPRFAVRIEAASTATLTRPTSSVEAALISGFTPSRTWL